MDHHSECSDSNARSQQEVVEDTKAFVEIVCCKPACNLFSKFCIHVNNCGLYRLKHIKAGLEKGAVNLRHHENVGQTTKHTTPFEKFYKLKIFLVNFVAVNALVLLGRRANLSDRNHDPDLKFLPSAGKLAGSLRFQNVSQILEQTLPRHSNTEAINKCLCSMCSEHEEFAKLNALLEEESSIS